jgi:hypothetical protein
MKKMLRPLLFSAPACALLAGCAQSPPPVQALPPGPTPAEVTDYAIAQTQYRAAEASGNGDVVTHAENTFWSISQEILSRQDPRLVAAWEVCEHTGWRRPTISATCDRPSSPNSFGTVRTLTGATPPQQV